MGPQFLCISKSLGLKPTGEGGTHLDLAKATGAELWLGPGVFLRPTKAAYNCPGLKEWPFWLKKTMTSSFLEETGSDVFMPFKAF